MAALLVENDEIGLRDLYQELARLQHFVISQI